MVRNFIIVLLIMAFLAACTSDSTPDAAVEKYLQAIVEKDSAQVSTLSCGEWETNALIMLDSFQAVSAELENLNCEEAGTSQDGMSVVSCTGKILATYGNELQEFDLSIQDYLVKNDNGEWLVCGMQ
jgi:hypothetical protein